jgi:hypothetical protein
VYGCETWSLSLRKVNRLRVLDIGVLREVSLPEGAGDNGGVDKNV